MFSDFKSASQSSRSTSIPVLWDRRAFKTCHIHLPDLPKPVGAIAYNNKLYSYVRFYSDVEAAQRAFDRLVTRGNVAVLTQVPKGLVLWVFEPDARLAE